MDLVLGVSVTGATARLAVVGGAAANTDVLGRLAHPLKATEQTQLATEVATLIFGVRTAQALQGRRLVGIGLCWDDADAVTLVQAQFIRMGIANAAVIERNVAAGRLVSELRDPGRGADEKTGLLLLTQDTATLALVDGDSIDTVATHPLAKHAVAACAVLIGELAPNTVDEVYLFGDNPNAIAQAETLGHATTIPIVVPDEPEFAVAVGAALVARGLVETPTPAATQSTAALTALLAAAAQRAQAQPRRATAPAMTIANFGSSGDGAPRYSDAVVRLQRQPPKPKMIEAPVAAAAEADLDELDEAPVARPKRAERSRRPRVLIGSAAATVVVAGVAAVAIITAAGVEPTADQGPVESTQVQAPVAPAPAAVEAIEQVNPEPPVDVPPLPVMVQAPLPETVADPVPVEFVPEPEAVEVVPEVPEAEAPVPEVVPEPVVVAPEANPDADNQLPSLVETQHVPNGTLPGPVGPDGVVPAPAIGG